MKQCRLLKLNNLFYLIDTKSQIKENDLVFNGISSRLERPVLPMKPGEFNTFKVFLFK